MDEIDPSHWRRLDGVLDELLSLPPERCAERLESLCGTDEELHRLAQQLLAAARESGLLDAPLSLSAGQGRMLLAGLLASSSPVLRTLGSLSTPALGSEPGRFVPGSTVAGRYRIVGLAGRGGMGEVYRADDLRLGQPVALKFLPKEFERDPVRANLLLAEVSMARRIAHPNVCRVYDVVEADDSIFLTMEYVDGENLGSLLLRIGRVPMARAEVIARQLASGLAAAHEMGIVHRDLKPANLMMDGRGRIRITDFGLAAAVDKIGREEIRAGTPRYMAPEQRAGQEVTERSDVYALGLVFYELFTGRRAFEGPRGPAASETPALPKNPQEVVEDLDPAIARVILRCLEPDPSNRPQSAIEVLRALPGGDALAAALAAGETPSPEIVAAAGPQGKIRPRTAGLLFAGFGITLAVVLLLADQALFLNRVALPKSVAALAADAGGIAERLGYDVTGWDSHSWSSFTWGAVQWYDENLKGAHRWDLIADPDAWVYLARHYFSPRPMVPTSPSGRPESSDLGWGAMNITTNPQGRLRFLEVKPWPAARDSGKPVPPDWNLIFDLTGLDRAAFDEVEPTVRPGMYADTRAAWAGTWPDGSGLPVRLEAAALGGRLVYFEGVFPFDFTWDPDAVESFPVGFNPLNTLGFFWWFFFGAITAIGGWLLVRNLRTGRGDRRGALRLSFAVLGVSFACWLFGAHHVRSLASEIWAGIAWLKGNLLPAVLTWALYIVLEPEIRRMRPDTLVAWTRLLAGRWRDPLVGRDLLVGLALGPLVVILGSQLHVVLPPLLGSTSPPAPFLFPFPGISNVFSGPLTPALLDARWSVAAAFAVLLYTIHSGSVFCLFFFLVQRILRFPGAAVAVVTLLNLALGWPAQLTGFSALGITLSLLWNLLEYGLLDRLGPLAFFGLVGVVMTYHNLPFTLDPTRPYFALGLATVAGLAALAVFAAAVACGRLERRVGDRIDGPRSVIARGLLAARRLIPLGPHGWSASARLR